VIGPVDSVGTIQTSRSGNVTWDPNHPPRSPVAEREDPLNLNIEDYAPGGAVASRVGIYHSIITPADDPDFRINNQGRLWKPMNRTLEGLYYVEGNVDIGPNNSFGAKGITVVATGEISFSGGTDVRYYQEGSGIAADGTGADGILFFSAYDAPNCGDNAIKLSGSATILTGVLYAPGAGLEISGAHLRIIGALIGDTVELSGSSLDLRYDPSLLPPRPPRIQIAE
jgi:hypothetical protein